jgi:mannose-6-phosphate isomerase-like protein (cupin superfamily)
MHVTTSELRSVRRGELLLGYAFLGGVVCAVAELGRHGTRDEPHEHCVQEHWGIVLRGTVVIERGSQRDVLGEGSAFYVPPGEPEHRFTAEGPALVAGFAPLPGDRATDEASVNEQVREAGFEALRRTPRSLAGLPEQPVRVVGLRPVSVRHSRIEAEAVRMGRWVYCMAHMGPTSGYAAAWCDAPHWGMVLSGGIAIEWEDDIEVLGPGDLYYCPPGPPGHRIEAADAATILDFTPLDSLRRGAMRVSEWRPRPEQLEGSPGDPRGEAVSP